MPKRLVSSIGSVASVLRTHWKKSLVASGCAGAAINYIRLRENDKIILTSYCNLAKQIGDQVTPTISKPRRVTAIVNPLGKDGKGPAAFEKTGLPLLHLAGLDVNVVKPQSADEFRQIVSVLDESETDDILIVGGDGAVSLGVSGLFDAVQDQSSSTKPIPLPVGIFPGGRRNLGISRMFPNVDRDVRWQCECVMSLINQIFKLKPVFKVEIDGEPSMFALSHIQWGPYRDIESLLKKYWYWGVLRRKFAYVWSCVKRAPEIGMLEFEYSPPCAGCNRCRVKAAVKPVEWRWWHALLGAPRQPIDLEPDFSQVNNPECGKTESYCVESCDFVTVNELGDNEPSCLAVHYGPRTLKRTQFISNGFQRDANVDPLGLQSTGETARAGGFTAQTLKVTPRMPMDQDNKCAWNTVDIDGSPTPVNGDQSVKLTLLPRRIKLYLPEKYSVAPA